MGFVKAGFELQAEKTATVKLAIQGPRGMPKSAFPAYKKLF
jgi:hypothetical protein